MDQFKEGEDNPFDAPIPGQGLTDTPGNYPWEHPPQYPTMEEATEYLWEKMTEPERAEQIIAMLDAGVPVETIARTALFGGFLNGRFTPDVAFTIAEPVMKMIATMGLTAGVEKIRMSMSDITNNEQIQSIVRTKVNAEETAQAEADEISISEMETQAQADKEAKDNLLASAKAKLMAGEPMTEKEANLTLHI